MKGRPLSHVALLGQCISTDESIRQTVGVTYEHLASAERQCVDAAQDEEMRPVRVIAPSYTASGNRYKPDRWRTLPPWTKRSFVELQTIGEPLIQLCLQRIIGRAAIRTRGAYSI